MHVPHRDIDPVKQRQEDILYKQQHTSVGKTTGESQAIIWFSTMMRLRGIFFVTSTILGFSVVVSS